MQQHHNGLYKRVDQLVATGSCDMVDFFKNRPSALDGTDFDLQPSEKANL